MTAFSWAIPVLLAVLGIVAGEQSTVHEGQAAESGTMAKAYFAGDVLSGYMGGSVKNPSYEDVSAGRTGHAESVEVRYDPRKLTYPQLLEVFWRNVDPVTPEAQFCDHGNQYRAAIFYQGEEEKHLAEESKRAIEQSKRFSTPIVTQVTAASEFYPAEEYHQDFYKKNPFRYKYYKFTCGRAQRLEALWGKS